VWRFSNSQIVNCSYICTGADRALLAGGKMRSRVLIVAVTTVTTIVGLSTQGQAGAWDVGYPAVVCEGYPPAYPRGWELMLRPRCGFNYGYYGPYSYHAYPRYAVVPSYPSYYRSRAYGHHHRPYLRPGWWW
jgi:hypothetical protein